MDDHAGADRSLADKPTLTGVLVTLRPVEPGDVTVLHGILRDPEVRVLTGTVTERRAAVDDPEDMERLLQWYSTRNEQTDRLDLMVVDNASGAVVGEVVLNQWDPEVGTCNYRTLIGPAGRDRGLGSEATRMVVDYAFEHLGLHRIDLEVFAFNPRAQRAYEKAGFVVEGRRREAHVLDGERVDAIVMGIIRPDWLALGRSGRTRTAAPPA